VKPKEAPTGAVLAYMDEARYRGVAPESASAVLLLNVLREVHTFLSQQHGNTIADDIIQAAITKSTDAFPRRPFTLI
jgi:hypothetical protein